MKHRALALALACALSLSLLTACGGNGGGSSSSSQGSDSSQGVSSSQGAGSGSQSDPDQSSPDASAPDASQPDSSVPEQSQPDDNTIVASLSLNKSDFTLFKAGATWQLKAKAEPAGGKQTWTSSDEAVATVSDTGLVTAVAAGSATITVTDEGTGLSASCTVRVRIEEEKPDEGSGSSSSGSDSSSGGSQSSDVDLSAFADQVMADYEFSFLSLADTTAMDSLYSGLSAVSTKQCLVYCTLMTMNNGEFALVQVSDSKDVDTVKGILQARIDQMINGGAWYPGPTEQWTNNSRVVSNGNYIMMVVHENCDDIVSAFNALF